MTRLSIATVVLVSTVAAASGTDRTEPNSFLMLGFDKTAKKLYLKEELGKKGPYDLWTIDFTSAQEPHIEIAPIKGDEKPPGELALVKSVQLDDVDFSGSIRKESLERNGNHLMKRYDLRVVVALNGARSTSDFIAYRNPELQLIETFMLPEGEGSCSVALVAYTSNLAGVVLQRPLVMCPGGSPVPLNKPSGKGAKK